MRGGNTPDAAGPRPLDASISRVLDRLGIPATVGVMDAVFGRWEEVAGPELSGHVRPRRITGNSLEVVADHPAWATRARLESPRILEALRESDGMLLERLEVTVERA